VFGNNDKLWNLITVNMYATDEEIEEMAPIILIVVAVVIIGFFVIRGCIGEEPQNSNQPPKTEQVE